MTIASSATARGTAGSPEGGRPHRARRGEGEQLRVRILDATEQLLIEQGDPEKISIRSVADAVDRTPPSIYLHFATKDELIHAVCERSFDLLADEFRAALAGVDDPVDQIRVMTRAYVDFAFDHPEQYRILFMSSAPNEITDLDGLRLTDCFGLLADAVERCIEQGRFRPLDPVMVSINMWALVHGFASLRIAHAHLQWPPLEEHLEALVDQALAGLLAPGDPARA